ncbi:MAG: hypothetical protein EPO21_13155 [Chloroflexota bacterium]|nr:MAG: hypothetical protein EPO21_13155 [Chloroflexota bacterium]
MATGKFVRAWQENGRAYLSVRVVEADGSPVEYIGSVALDDLQGLTAAQQRAALVNAVKMERARNIGTAVDLPGFSSTIAL